jgi:biotin-dependent carboxylase-like uncharacterized protein
MSGPAVLEILAALGPAMVQDGGRRGRMHEAVPPGGALVPELLAAANRALGNAPGAAGLEVYGELRLAVQGGAPAMLSVDGELRPVPPGAPVVIERPREHVVRYVAVPGGIEVPEVLGGRGTLLQARLGGYQGRLLQKGDRLSMAGGQPVTGRGEPALSLDLSAPIRVIAGPDLDRFSPAALDILTSSELTVSPHSDRTGMRLIGPALARLGDDTPGPAPMVRGAIQVPAAGEAIVLGPDHPVTGGYPVLATVIRADLGRLAARRPGATVRFTAVERTAPVDTSLGLSSTPKTVHLKPGRIM